MILLLFTPNAIFSEIVCSVIKIFWGTLATQENQFSFSLIIGFLSTEISPELGFNSPNIKSASVLFPEPLFPIIPTLDPAEIIRLIFFKTNLLLEL